MHTPGPWQAHERSDIPPFVSREGEAAGWICQTVTWCGLDEAKANARLIASAPVMLDALKITRGNVASLGPAGVFESYREWLVMLDEAIAKAETPAA